MGQVSIGIFECTFEFSELGGTITTLIRGNHIVESIREALNSELISPDEFNELDSISLTNRN